MIQKLPEPLHLLCHNLKTSVSRTHTRNYLEISFTSFCLSSLACVFISSFEPAPVDYFHKSAIHQASVASALAEDDNSCQDLTMPSQQVGQEGAAWDNIKQDCLTWGERPVVRHSIRRGQKGLPISKGHEAVSICHSEALDSSILFHMQTERCWKPLKGEVPHRANVAGGEQLLMRRVELSTG